MTTFFTSDHHFGHANIIKYCNRPFSSVEEMDEIMIQRWNERVNPDDNVYHLGDFSISKNDSYVDSIFEQLNGRIFITKGNHDQWMYREGIFPMTKTDVVTLIPPLFELYTFLPELKNKKRHLPIVLSHYAMRTWNVSHHGSWHLFGHSHGQLISQGKSFDVGVDTNNFYPYSLEEISEKMRVLEVN